MGKRLNHTTCIYAIINSWNGILYVGSAVDFNNRKSSHISHLNKKKHKNIYLQNAWNKYGESGFEFRILELVENKKFLIKKEQVWLDWFECWDRTKGYNLCNVAGSQLGVKWTEESRKRQSIIQTGKKMSPEAIVKTIAGNTGKKRSIEQRATMSAAQKGRKQSLEHIAKLSVIRKGKSRSEASKQKLKDTIARKKIEQEQLYA